MTVKFKPDLLEAALAQIGERAIKGMSEKMRKIAIRMRDLARSYAPHKTGLLEEEIHYGVVKDAKRRNVYVVYIDLDHARKTRPSGKTPDGVLGDYAWIMEEQLHPYGRTKGKVLTLGAKSRAKAAEGNKVGGRFLSRAFIEATKNIEQELAAEVRRVLGQSRQGPVGYVRETDEDEE